MASSPALSQLLRAALEPRMARLRELSSMDGWKDDAEALHQVRIASRRVRAVLDLMDPELDPESRRPRRRLRRLTRILSLTRELDVHVEELEILRAETADTLRLATVDFLLEDLDRKRRKARKTLARGLGRILPKALERWADRPVPVDSAPSEALPASVWSCLEPRLRAVDQAIPPLLEREEPLGLHKLRIHVKRLRYTLEVLEPAFPQSLEAYLQTLKALQAELGQHHDHGVLEAHLWKRHGALSGRGRTTLAAGVLDLIGRIAERRRTHYARFRDLGQRQQSERPFLHLRGMLESTAEGPP